MGTSLFKAKCPIFFISSYPKIVPPWTSTRSFKLAPDSSWHVHVILWALPRFRHSKTLPASLVPLLPQHHSHPLLHGAQWLSPRSAYALYSMLPGCLCAHTRVHAHTLTHTIYIYLSVCWKRIHTSSDGIHSSFFSRHISNSLTLRNPAPQNLGIFALCIKSMMSSDLPPGPPPFQPLSPGDALTLVCPVPSSRATSPSALTLPYPSSIPASGFWTELFRKGKGNHFSHSHLIVYILFF